MQGLLLLGPVKILLTAILSLVYSLLRVYSSVWIVFLHLVYMELVFYRSLEKNFKAKNNDFSFSNLNT